MLSHSSVEDYDHVIFFCQHLSIAAPVAACGASLTSAPLRLQRSAFAICELAPTNRFSHFQQHARHRSARTRGENCQRVLITQIACPAEHSFIAILLVVSTAHRSAFRRHYLLRQAARPEEKRPSRRATFHSAKTHAPRAPGKSFALEVRTALPNPGKSQYRVCPPVSRTTQLITYWVPRSWSGHSGKPTPNIDEPTHNEHPRLCHRRNIKCRRNCQSLLRHGRN